MAASIVDYYNLSNKERIVMVLPAAINYYFLNWQN